MIKKIALLAILGVLAGCASEPPLTAQDIQKMATEAATSAPFSEVDEGRELTVAFENNYMLYFRDEFEKGQDIKQVMAITDTYSHNSWPGYKYACYIIARLYNTGNKEYASVTSTVSGQYLSGQNAWAPFKVSSNAGKVSPVSQKLVAFRLDAQVCKMVKDVRISLTTCVDAAVGDRRCQ